MALFCERVSEVSEVDGFVEDVVKVFDGCEEVGSEGLVSVEMTVRSNSCERLRVTCNCPIRRMDLVTAICVSVCVGICVEAVVGMNADGDELGGLVLLETTAIGSPRASVEHNISIENQRDQRRDFLTIAVNKRKEENNIWQQNECG